MSEFYAPIYKKIINVNENDRMLEKIYPVYGLDYKPKPIRIFIDSFGGVVYVLLGTIGLIQQSKTPVHTIGMGAAMSCGFLLLICGHKRFMTKEATIMYHQISAGNLGSIKELEENLEQLQFLQHKIEEMTIKYTDISKNKLQKVRKKKFDWYINVEEALKHGMVDEIFKMN